MNKLRAGILGATGMVGQRFITLLTNHPWIRVTCLAASPKARGKTYEEAVAGRWQMDVNIPEYAKKITLYAVEEDTDRIAANVDFVFSAMEMDKEKIKETEIKYAQKEIAVVSNNSAHRFTDDVPMVMPEINPHHLKLIDGQRKNRGWKKGMIAVKPNCSIQSYVSILTALKNYQPQKVWVTSLQAISGAGKTFNNWPEMLDNVIPLIKGEEEKSEKEPLKIWGTVKGNRIDYAKLPSIAATCIRVPVSDGHMACVTVSFKKKLRREEIISAVKKYQPLKLLNLPSAPKEFIRYFEDENRPQTKLDRNHENGMGITMGRLREDSHLNWAFIALSHNTIRGAAGGAILLAELLIKKKYIT